MSSLSPAQPPEGNRPVFLPPLSFRDVLLNICSLEGDRKERVADLLAEVGQGDFWSSHRCVQVLRMLRRKDAFRVKQVDIATALGVSKSLVTRLKQDFLDHPDETRPRPGRPSELNDVYQLLVTFIATEIRECRAVTMSVLLSYANDILPFPVVRKTLYTFMRRHNFAYASANPTDALRVTLRAQDIINFYVNDLPDTLNGAHPSLVFNVDEMGAETFADRKRIFVFLPESDVPANGSPTVGVPRSTRRCTLVACVSLDGTRLCPAVITKTVTISSAVFSQGGYTPDRLRIYQTDNSFINNDVFGEWLCDIFLPEVHRRRKWLAETLGIYNQRAVLIIDGCSCHKAEAFKELLRRHNVAMLFLVPHSSHMTQPLDVGIFANVKQLIRSDTKYVINLHKLDQAIVRQIEAENLRDYRVEKGQLLAEYVLKILRAFEQATTADHIISAFRQVGVHSKLEVRGNLNRWVSFADPTTARVVVSNYGRIELPVNKRTEPAPTWQLKIADLNWAHRTEPTRGLQRELEEIQAAIPPRQQRTFSTAQLTPSDGLRGRTWQRRRRGGQRGVLPSLNEAASAMFDGRTAGLQGPRAIRRNSERQTCLGRSAGCANNVPTDLTSATAHAGIPRNITSHIPSPACSVHNVTHCLPCLTSAGARADPARNLPVPVLTPS